MKENTADAGNSLSFDDVLGDIRALFLEAAVGPEDPARTWFTDNEDGSGLLGSVRNISAGTAFAEPLVGLDSIAAHIQHAAYYIDLATKAFRGENVYARADWKGSWVLVERNAEEWERIRQGFESSINLLNAVFKGGIDLSDSNLRKGALALVAHTAWHLGAVRQLLVVAG